MLTITCRTCLSRFRPTRRELALARITRRIGCPHCGYAGRIEAPPAAPRPRRLGGEVSGR